MRALPRWLYAFSADLCFVCRNRNGKRPTAKSLHSASGLLSTGGVGNTRGLPDYLARQNRRVRRTLVLRNNSTGCAWFWTARTGIRGAYCSENAGFLSKYGFIADAASCASSLLPAGSDRHRTAGNKRGSRVYWTRCLRSHTGILLAATTRQQRRPIIGPSGH